MALVENRLTDEQRQKLILPNHALHAARVSFERSGERIFEAKPEKEFGEFAATV
jgi:hypothetical protein